MVKGRSVVHSTGHWFHWSRRLGLMMSLNSLISNVSSAGFGGPSAGILQVLNPSTDRFMKCFKVLFLIWCTSAISFRFLESPKTYYASLFKYNVSLAPSWEV